MAPLIACSEESGSDNRWIIQKFGGTSIGKYPLNIIQNVVK